LRRRGRGQSGGHQLKTDWAKQTGRGLLKYLQKGSFRRASWKTFADVKQTFGSADQVTVPNGYQVVVFNIGGGAFRLITAIHYNRGIVYIRKFLTHAEYSKEEWKNDP
jgi:mRNA-degrading endonuclease HigB of HigAB toxin-antitoxin module